MTIYRSGSTRSYSVRTSFYKSAVYYVVEHRHDGERFPSTGRADRVVSGPWLYGEQAQQDAQHRADVAASLARIKREIAALEAEAQWGREHPYARVCGEDDARQDRLDYLRAELAEARA